MTATPQPTTEAQMLADLECQQFVADVQYGNEKGTLSRTGVFTTHTVRPPDYSELAVQIEAERAQVEERSRASLYYRATDMDWRRQHLTEVIVRGGLSAV